MSSLLSWIVWDPSPDLFFIPLLHHPVKWYGLLFVLGFIIGIFILTPIFSKELKIPKDESRSLVDKVTWFVILATIIGARLGHVFLYDWPHFREHPEDIYKIWEGGLASHGATIGILCALLLFTVVFRKKHPNLTFISLLDMLAIPVALVCGMIRIGNFINQEILGTKTTLPWGIIFGHPADGSIPVPRHPVQLYEAICYFLICAFLWWKWNYSSKTLAPGKLSGLFFLLMFSARFLLEFFKTPQSSMIDESFLHTGQYLSLPFIAVGFLLYFRNEYKHSNVVEKNLIDKK